jgi:hypothetical protein
MPSNREDISGLLLSKSYPLPEGSREIRASLRSRAVDNIKVILLARNLFLTKQPSRIQLHGA